MQYTVVKQKRKTATIVVNDNLEVIVKVPRYITKKQIELLLHEHVNWINETLQKKKAQRERIDWYQTGEILYLGKYYPVQIMKMTGRKPSVQFDESCFSIYTDGSEACARKEMEKFFRVQAKEKLTDLANQYSKCLGVAYNQLTIRKQVTRWGSCSSKGNLSFNVKLVCAPVEMMAYVALHEVAHLKHFNHSQAFWKEIERWMPDYKERMNYFKQFGQNFMI